MYTTIVFTIIIDSGLNYKIIAKLVENYKTNVIQKKGSFRYYLRMCKKLFSKIITKSLFMFEEEVVSCKYLLFV